MSFEKLADQAGPPPTRLRWWHAAVILALLALGGAVLWQQGKVRRAEAEAVRERERQALAALAQAEQAVEAAGADEAPRAAALGDLLKAQRAVADLRPAELNVRAAGIERTEVELRRIGGATDRQRAAERERVAAELLRAGDFAAAVPVLREAIEAQRAAVRAGGERARGNDELRRLEQELVRALAEPVEARRRVAVAAAEAANRAGQWEEARVHYHEARGLQEQLNREHPGSRYSDLAALARIENEIATLTADGLEARVEERWNEARHAAAGRDALAERLFEEAAEAQRTLNTRFPRSRFVSMERLEQIEADVQTLRAAPAWTEIERLAGAARLHLQRRQVFQAQAVVQQALDAAEQLRTSLPRARGGNELLRLQLAFLNQRSAELTAVQDEVYDRLAPLGTGRGVALSRAEVEQELFAKLMKGNPSRSGGRKRPVESVTHAEAAEFCRRLTWVMGWPVRLPTAEEMRAAGREADTFAGLDSGVHEWLGAAGETWIWTGTDAVPATGRAADRGFRIVVEVDLAAER